MTVDPARAKSLVNEAGYPQGVEVEFIYPGLKYGQILVTKLQLLQAQLKKGNVNLKLKSIDPGEENRRWVSGDFQLAKTLNGFLIMGECDPTLYGLDYPGSPNNYGRVNDPELTPLLMAQRREPDQAKRREIWRQASRRVNEGPWAQALYYPPNYDISRPYLKNYHPSSAPSIGTGLDLLNSWLEK